jgi:hypothetical protein
MKKRHKSNVRNSGFWKPPETPYFTEAELDIDKLEPFSLNIHDHHGRIFDRDFFVSGDHEHGFGLFVWAHSASGASKVVARPKGRRRGKWCGWGNYKNAARVAAVLSRLANAPDNTKWMRRAGLGQPESPSTPTPLATQAGQMPT